LERQSNLVRWRKGRRFPSTHIGRFRLLCVSIVARIIA
jgi:hypothetical protein